MIEDNYIYIYIMETFIILWYIIFIFFCIKIWIKIKKNNDIELSKKLNDYFLIIIIIKLFIIIYLLMKYNSFCNMSKKIYC